MPPSFSHSLQCRTTRREGDNKGVGKKRTPGITKASDKAHHVQDTGVKGHGSFTIIVSRSSFSISLRLSSPFRPLFSEYLRCQASSGSAGVQAMYTRGDNKRNGTKTREKETNDERELFSRQKPRHFLWNLVDVVYPVLVEWVTLGYPSPLPRAARPTSQVSRGLSLNLSRDRCPRASPALTLPSPSFNLFSRVACSLVPLLLFSLGPCCRRYVECANKSCTNVPEVWTRSPINYSVGAVDPPSLFRAAPLSPFHLVRLPRAFISPAPASRRGSGVKFILQIYSFIYCERLFTPVPPDRITVAEREMYHTLPTGSYGDAWYDWPLYRRFLIAVEDITIFSFVYIRHPILKNL